MGWGLFHIQAKEEAAKFSPKGCLPASQSCKGVGEGLPAPAWVSEQLAVRRGAVSASGPCQVETLGWGLLSIKENKNKRS